MPESIPSQVRAQSRKGVNLFKIRHVRTQNKKGSVRLKKKVHCVLCLVCAQSGEIGTLSKGSQRASRDETVKAVWALRRKIEVVVGETFLHILFRHPEPTVRTIRANIRRRNVTKI